MTVIVLTSGTSWTAPTDCVSIDTLEMWGGNASGAGPQTTAGQCGGGGGAGAYARWATIAVTPSTAYTTAIGAGGARKSGGVGIDGGATTITIGATTYTVPGGTHGLSGTAGTGGAGGAGGPTASVAPAAAAAFKGGDGGAGVTGPHNGGGGGGSPGTTGAGGNAGTAPAAGAAGAGGGTAGGGGGVTAAQSAADGANPDGTGTPGSAGGGGYFDGTVSEHSGSGGGGQIVITYTPSVGGTTRVAVNIGFDVAHGDWATTNALIGPGDTHRLFYNTTNRLLPATFDADGTPASVLVITSYKIQNTNVASYIASVPNNRSLVMIYHHEPEGDYANGSTFVSEFKAQSDLIRAAQAARGDLGVNIRVGMCSAGFPYRDLGSSDVLAGNYLTGLGRISGVSGKPYADLFTRDVYQGTAGAGGFDWPSAGLSNYHQWLNWLALVTGKNVATSSITRAAGLATGVARPLGITEYGITTGPGLTNADRNQRIQDDRDYLRASFTPGGPSAVSASPLQLWCYWFQCIDVNCTNFSDAATIATWQGIEAGGLPPPAGAALAVTGVENETVTALLVSPGVPPAPPAPPVIFPTRRDWHFLTGPPSGGYATELAQATGRSITWRLTDAHEAVFTVNAATGYDQGLAELTTDVHVVRGGTPLFRGRVLQSSDDISASAHLASFTAEGYRFILEHRILFSDSRLVYKDLDVGSIVWGLLSDTQGRRGGALGITQGQGFPFGSAGTKTCVPGDFVAEKIDDIAYVDNSTPGAGGFDWDITPHDSFAQTIDLWPVARGSDNGVILQRGDAISSEHWTRSLDAGTFADAGRMTGSGTTPPVPVELEVTGLVSRPEGRWDAAWQCDENDATRLAARAALQLNTAQTLIPSWSVPLRPGAWGGPDHIWIGDTVTVRPHSGRLTGADRLRVLELAAVLTQDGEQITLTIGAPRPNQARQLRRIVNELKSVRKKRVTGSLPFVLSAH